MSAVGDDRKRLLGDIELLDIDGLGAEAPESLAGSEVMAEQARDLLAGI